MVNCQRMDVHSQNRWLIEGEPTYNQILTSSMLDRLGGSK